MTGKAVGINFLVPGNQFARSYHQVRIAEDEHSEDDKVDRQQTFDDGVQCQPQNRKMPRMCPRDSTTKTTKIGIWTLRHLVITS